MEVVAGVNATIGLALSDAQIQQDGGRANQLERLLERDPSVLESLFIERFDALLVTLTRNVFDRVAHRRGTLCKGGAW
jgi:hypothetical protein